MTKINKQQVNDPQSNLPNQTKLIKNNNLKQNQTI